jgi:metallo-beta-lactamase family protein
VIIPAFSLGRTQQVIYFLNQLTNEGKLPLLPIYVDSPLSARITSVYRRHLDIMDADVQKLLTKDDDAFGFPALSHIQSHQESMELNRRKGPFVVIAASGMCENGRVLHHLKHSVGDRRNTIVIIGFQAEHTLGRRILERQERLRIYDRFYTLNAKVEELQGLSAHADAEDFKWWFEHLAKDTGVGQTFLVHGEPTAATALAALIRDDCDEEPIVPALYQTFEV